MTPADAFAKTLIDELDLCAEKYSESRDALAFDCSDAFRGQPETPGNALVHNADIYLNSCIIRFSYYPHLPFSTAHSVLTCFVSPDKAEARRLFYPLSALYGFFGICPANALTIPLILSAESMRESFELIAADLDAALPLIIELSASHEKKSDFFDAEAKYAADYLKRKYPTDKEIGVYLAEIGELPGALPADSRADKDGAAGQAGYPEAAAVSGEALRRLGGDIRAALENDRQACFELCCSVMLAWSAGPALEAYMTGDYARSIRKLRKKKHKSAYELLLIRRMETDASPRPHVPESVRMALTELYKNGIPKNNAKEALLVAPAMLFFGLWWLPLFLGVYFLFYFLERRGASFLLGPLENAPSAALPSMICGIPMIYFHSGLFYKLFFRKNVRGLTAIGTAADSHFARRIMKGLTAFLVLCSFVFLALTVRQNIKLTESGIYDNHSFWSVRGDFYPYDEIEGVYYREKTPDGYGGKIDMPSYVIRLKNGGELDPYRLNTLDKKFLDTLRNAGVYVEAPRGFRRP